MPTNRRAAFQARKAAGNGSPLKQAKNAAQNAIELLFDNNKPGELIAVANRGLDQAALVSLERELTDNEKNIIAVCGDYEKRAFAFYLFFSEGPEVSVNKKLCQEIWLLTKDSSKLGESDPELSRQDCWRSLKLKKGDSQGKIEAIQKRIANLISLYQGKPFDKDHPIFLGNYYATHLAVSKMPHELRLDLWRRAISSPDQGGNLTYGEVLKAVYSLSDESQRAELMTNFYISNDTEAEDDALEGETSLDRSFTTFDSVDIKFNFFVTAIGQCENVQDIAVLLKEFFNDIKQGDIDKIVDIFLEETDSLVITNFLSIASFQEVWQKFSLEQQKAIFLKAAASNLGEFVVKIAEFYKDIPVFVVDENSSQQAAAQAKSFDEGQDSSDDEEQDLPDETLNPNHPLNWQDEQGDTAVFMLLCKGEVDEKSIYKLFEMNAYPFSQNNLFDASDISSDGAKKMLEYYQKLKTFKDIQRDFSAQECEQDLCDDNHFAKLPRDAKAAFFKAWDKIFVNCHSKVGKDFVLDLKKLTTVYVGIKVVDGNVAWVEESVALNDSDKKALGEAFSRGTAFETTEEPEASVAMPANQQKKFREEFLVMDLAKASLAQNCCELNEIIKEWKKQFAAQDKVSALRQQALAGALSDGESSESEEDSPSSSTKASPAALRRVAKSTNLQALGAGGTGSP